MKSILEKIKLAGLGLVVGFVLTSGATLACQTGQTECCATTCGSDKKACAACCKTAKHAKKKDCPSHCKQGHCGQSGGKPGGKKK